MFHLYGGGCALPSTISHYVTYLIIMEAARMLFSTIELSYISMYI